MISYAMVASKAIRFMTHYTIVFVFYVRSMFHMFRDTTLSILILTAKEPPTHQDVHVPIWITLSIMISR